MACKHGRCAVHESCNEKKCGWFEPISVKTIPGSARIIEDIQSNINKFREIQIGVPDTLIIGTKLDSELTEFINGNELHNLDGNISTVHNCEFHGLKIRVVDGEEDLLEVAITRWREL